MQTVRQNNHQSFRTTVTHFVSSFAFPFLCFKITVNYLFSHRQQSSNNANGFPIPTPRNHCAASRCWRSNFATSFFITNPPTPPYILACRMETKRFATNLKGEIAQSVTIASRRAVRFAHGIASRQHHYHGTHVAPGTSAYDTNRV